MSLIVNRESPTGQNQRPVIFDCAIRFTRGQVDASGHDDIDKTAPLARLVKDFVLTIGDEVG